ncbi:F-box protein CPR30-like [Cucurbita moschata]|uniref:F-box protein CPR30-like n=1 Tax=Cucurbita moschata TaxID=3662 RepID=A0A6J1G2M5_CUCMO|nr:F-box protein CPR30-like [Cucurbita moschata]
MAAEIVGNNLEMAMEILSHLPPETLLRFKSVQKSWYALINDPQFVSKNLSNSLEHKCILLKRVVMNNAGEEEIMLSILNFPFNSSMSVIDLDIPYDEYSRFYKIHGHSHGLICFARCGVDIFLCNPATREFRKLPPSILLTTRPSNNPDTHRSTTNSIGFGYDAKSRDFKVLRVVYFFNDARHFLYYKAEIYHLSKDRWREIEFPSYGYSSYTPEFDLYHEGVYYWWERNGKNILSFDMSEEIFGKISLPKSFNTKNLNRENCKILGVLNGSIVVFDHECEVNDENTFYIWEMKKDECGVISWSNLLTIGPILGIRKPLLFVSSDEVLMEDNEAQMVLYNIKTQLMNVIPLKGQAILIRCQQATFVTKSLISVMGGNNSMSYVR